MVLDASKPVTYKKLLEKELHGFGIRLNQKKPNVYFKRHDKGGIQLHVQLPHAPTWITQDILKTILTVNQDKKNLLFQFQCSSLSSFPTRHASS
jgi:ribosome-interacting GTPase 1